MTSRRRVVTVLVLIAVGLGLTIVVARCVAAKDERITTNLDRAKRCTDAGHIIRKERQGRNSANFTYWCTDTDGRLYDLWFDSGRDYRKGPETR